jgi:hypothetical protein
VVTPDRFFLAGLPAMIARQLEAFSLMRGVAVFHVGERAWTVRFGDLERPVDDEIAADPDLEVSFSEPAFGAFLDETLDLGAALGSGELRVVGDASILGHLGVLLQPPQNPLSARLGAF